MAKRRAVRRTRAKNAPKKVRTGNMPAGLKRFYQAVNKGLVQDPHTGRRQRHKRQKQLCKPAAAELFVVVLWLFCVIQ